MATVKSIEAAMDGPGKDADVVVLDLELGDGQAGGKLMTDQVAGLCDVYLQPATLPAATSPPNTSPQGSWDLILSIASKS